MTPAVALAVLLITPVAPLALALAVLLRPRSRALHVLAALAAAPGVATSLAMPPGLAATLPWLLAGSEFGLDETGRVFLFFTAVIWLAAGVYALGSVSLQRRGRFYVFFLLAMSGNLGLIVARDMLAFYLFFALMSFAAYGLVVHDASPAARRAGRVYMLLVVAGDMLLFAALALAALDTGGVLMLELVSGSLTAAPYRDVIVALVVFGFGVKAGLLGPHVALPLIYGVAPAPAAAALAGAMLHAGVLGWLRFLPSHPTMEFWGAALAAIGIAAAVYGVAVGLVQRRPAVVLAYSSISQAGIMTAGVGAALASPEHAAAIFGAVTVYAFHHGFAKATLFLGLDAVASSAIAGGAADARAPRAMRAAYWACLLLPSLALTGAPLTSGMLAKELLKETAAEAAAPSAAAFAAALPWTALLTTLLVARFLWLVRAAARSAGASERGASPSVAQAAACVSLLLASLAAVWLLPLEEGPALWTAAALASITWPVLAGAALAALWARGRSRDPAPGGSGFSRDPAPGGSGFSRDPAPGGSGFSRDPAPGGSGFSRDPAPGGSGFSRDRAPARRDIPAIPAGDIVAVVAPAGRRFVALWVLLACRALPRLRRRVLHAVRTLIWRPPWSRAAGRSEAALIEWQTAVTLLVALIVTLVAITAFA